MIIYQGPFIVIRKIRNNFAHEVKSGSLDAGSHADRVKELLRYFEGIEDYDKDVATFDTNEENRLGVHFRFICAILTIRLEDASILCVPIQSCGTSLIPPSQTKKAPPKK